MLVDTSNGAADIDADVCIVGAGPAGITLARQLAALPVTVTVLESGGLERDEKTHDLTRGEVSGLPYDLTESRLRYFGGTTNHWGGLCRPLQEIDFEARAWVPESGWPFPRSELDPYYERAQEVVRLGPLSFEMPSVQAEYPALRSFVDDERLDTAIFKVHALRFGPEYRGELEASPNVTVYLHANVVEIVLGPDEDAVAELRVATLTGSRFSVSARLFVLAAGGIENARLLLASNNQRSNGIGNDHDLVGRYFMEHPHLTRAATLLVPAPRSDERAWFYGGDGPLPGEGERPGSTFGAFTFPDAVAAEDRLLGFSAILVPPHPAVAERPGEPVPSGDVESLLRDEHAPDPFHRFELRVQAEQIPHPENRVTLTDEVDALGTPTVHLHWDVTDTDREAFDRALALLARRFAPHGMRMWIGEDFGDEEGSIVGGSHHMGTTRMHSHPSQGVVDAQCRVHGVANLYVAGSAVFPTSGYANPTLTIVALALRLADELARRLLT